MLTIRNFFRNSASSQSQIRKDDNIDKIYKKMHERSMFHKEGSLSPTSSESQPPQQPPQEIVSKEPFNYMR